MLDDENFQCQFPYKRTLQLLMDEKLVLDSDSFPLVEAAEAGNRQAMHSLHSKLTSGEINSSKNYFLALRYLQRLRRLDGNDYKLRFYSTRCLGDTHFKFGNYRKAQKEYINAARIMVNLPIKEWDFEMLCDLKQLIEIN